MVTLPITPRAAVAQRVDLAPRASRDMNERKTEDMVERRLRARGYYSPTSGITVEKQQSESPRIRKLLQHASKSGQGIGRPEFLIRSSGTADFLVVFECKAQTSKHESPTRQKYRDYAVDGVLLYASFLSKQFDVLAIAVSGEDEASIRISHFLHLKGQPQPTDWNVAADVVSLDDYYGAFIKSDVKFRQDYQNLLDYSRSLNDELHSKKITESQRAFLISGILIALKNRAFRQSYLSHVSAQQLSASLVDTIRAEFDNASIPIERRDTLMQSFMFIKILPTEKQFIEDLVSDINENINTFIKTHEYYDTIGQFYVEFLRYANNDKGLGIVLTPPHVGELFALLADVNRHSVVFDNCCGTSGLLIAGMKQMVANAGADQDVQRRIKNEHLFGIEYQPGVYSLAVCNMVLHDDGKANVRRGDCFDDHTDLFEIIDANGTAVTKRPTVGFLNPPYKSKRMPNDREELEFVLNNLEYLDPQKGSRCIAIVPITCATNPDGVIGELKRRMLERHTLEAVMSMPIDLFHNSKTTVVTCVMVLTAHRPHPRGKKTWFAYWRDDGFVKTKHRGRIDIHGVWPRVRDTWIQAFVNREVKSGFSAMQEVGHQDEWCAEAYMETDYGCIGPETLARASVTYFVNQAMTEGMG